MRFLKSQFRRINIALFSLLILLCAAVAPDRQLAKAPAVAQCPPITINPASLPGATVGKQYSQSVFPVGGAPPYTISVFIGALPPGLSLSFNTITGTPTTAGSYGFTLRVRDANNCFGVRAYTINVAACPTINIPLSSFGATVGVTYKNTIGASGGAAPYTFSLVPPNNIPPGLTLSSDGLLSGTPTTAGSYSFGVRATDANGCAGSKTITANICPTITFSPPGILTGRVGMAYSWGFHASGGQSPYTYAITSGSLPPGLTLSPGSITGTPTTEGSYTFTLRAVDANGCKGERQYTLVVVCPTITVNPTTVPVAQVGLSYNQMFSATGGTAPYSFSISSGALPNGLSLASNGSLSGAPTSAGNFSFTVRATDANGCVGLRNYTLAVNNPACPAITLNPSFLPVPRVGSAYSQTISATGGTAPYSFSIASGALPPGLSLASNGSLSGSPTSTGSYSFTVRATDASGCTGTRAYTQNVLPCEGITISPTGTGVPSATVNVPYNLTFTATGGAAPYTFSLGNFSFLPPGLTLSSSGLLSGTPTTGGNFSFLVVATSANGCLGQVLTSLNINDPACPDINISPSALPAGVTGASYSHTFTASGGAGPYSFAIESGALPAGFSLATNGNLTGTTTTAGNYGFSVRATDANGCAGVRGYTLVINNPTCPTITVNPTSATLPAGVTGAAYSQSFSATGGAAPYSFSITLGASPPGLSLAENGALTGAPTTTGSYSFTVRATDANGCVGERTYTLAINNPVCPTITVNPANSTLPAGVTGAPYNQTFTATGGTAPYTFNVTTGALPPGLSLAPNGNLTGSPTTDGNYNFTVRATDASGCAGQRGYTLVINEPTCPTITITPANMALPTGAVGGAYNQTFSAAGGTAPYLFTISAGGAPPGLSLAPNGALTGSPAVAGSYNFTARATDANGCLTERAYTIVIALNAVTSVSAASFAANTPVAPESIVAAFGANMATGVQSASTLPLPTQLAGVSLKVTDDAGAERLAPLFFVSPSQINYQMPPGAAVGPATVTVMNGAGATAEGGVEIVSVSPGLFTANSSGQGFASALVLRVKADGTQSYEPVAQYDATQNGFVAVPIDLGPETDQVFLILYGTGFKFRSSPSAVSCVIGGENVEVLYAGEAPGFVGLDQINARLPRALAGRGEVDVELSVDGKAANTARVAFR